MRSASGRATLKHNPGTETRDKGRGRPLIINHVGHYLADSLSLAPSHTHTYIHTHTKKHTHLQTLYIPLTASSCLYLSDRYMFCRFSSHPFWASSQLRRWSARDKCSNQAGFCIASWQDRLCWCVCPRTCECVFRSIWQSSDSSWEKTSVYLAWWEASVYLISAVESQAGCRSKNTTKNDVKETRYSRKADNYVNTAQFW